ncbi:hypothetical protein Droror1_Dr00028299, partial [Drosera rotundifolia]
MAMREGVREDRGVPCPGRFEFYKLKPEEEQGWLMGWVWSSKLCGSKGSSVKVLIARFWLQLVDLGL